jgi:hypothetical protein
MALTVQELAAQILASDDLSVLKVTVREWKDGTGKPLVLGIRVMTVEERDSYEKEWIGNKERGIDNFRTKYLARCLCHPENGERLFDEQGIEQLAKKSSAVVSKLFEKAMKHNNMTESDVEELAKN